MVLDSWITPEETPDLAAEATAVIDGRLARLTEGQRLAFWASITKAYNTPYNAKAKQEPVVIVTTRDETVVPFHELPIAAIAASALAPETHAA